MVFKPSNNQRVVNFVKYTRNSVEINANTNQMGNRKIGRIAHFRSKTFWFLEWFAICINNYNRQVKVNNKIISRITVSEQISTLVVILVDGDSTGTHRDVKVRNALIVVCVMTSRVHLIGFAVLDTLAV